MNNGLEVPQVGAFSSGAHQAEGRGSKPAYAYIERSFRWAHEADPQAQLFYNDPRRR